MNYIPRTLVSGYGVIDLLVISCFDKIIFNSLPKNSGKLSQKEKKKLKLLFKLISSQSYKISIIFRLNFLVFFYLALIIRSFINCKRYLK